jgi:DivIVA domain-containing protein
MESSGAARRAGAGGAAFRGVAGVPDGLSGVAGSRPRLTGTRVRAARFGRGPWRRGLDPDEVYGLLDWVADELDLRAREVAAALAEADRVKEALRRWQTRNARTGWSTQQNPSSRTG